MLIQELTRQASLDLLARMHLGRLACTRGARPYVVPVYFAYDNGYLYSFSTVGQKIEWMRANPLVCVEADEVVSPEQWMSIIVFGRYEELPDTPEWEGARIRAYTVLKRNAVWWEPAYVKTILHGTQRPLVPVFYRIHGLQITGHRATPEPVTPANTRLSMTDSGEDGWLHNLLRQVRSSLLARREAGAEVTGRPRPYVRRRRPALAVTRAREGPNVPRVAFGNADAARARGARSAAASPAR
ncbi:MAG: hypothetical protein A3F92_09160 [Candidatus Rokubacteria bacterium RIFCSPLOWO2_12_FULL_71_22]|nr:MAG: hypothetical protein A3F92_09160 [Candidatus Rokubacteria bacterium RIFCSPLOWO2_12_FULL_71_22]